MRHILPLPRICRAAALVTVFAVAITVAPTPAYSSVRAAEVATTMAGDRTAAEGVDSFGLIGASWSGSATDSARVRVKTERGWGPWSDLEVEEDHGPDARTAEVESGRTVTAPLWVGDATGYELDVPAGAADVQAHLVRETTRRVGAALVDRPAAAATSGPAISSRSRWSAREPKATPSYASTVKMAFVHHTVNSNDYASTDVPSMLRSIQAYHMDANGWDDIAYNFLIDRFGGIWEGRAGGVDRAVIGAHTQGFNTSSTGAAVIGEFTNVAPPRAVLDALGQLIGWKLPLSGVDPAGTTTMTSGGNDKYADGQVATFDNVSGHRDGKATACPGERLYARLPDIRADASARAGSATAYPGFEGGMYIAAGELDGDAANEFITGAERPGGPHIRTFDASGGPRRSFFAYDPKFTGGVRVAAGDVDLLPGDDEIITAAGPGGGPHIRVFHEDGGDAGSFMAYDPRFTGGVYVAAGDVDGLLGDEIITAPGPGGGPHVRVFTAGGTEIGSFMAYDSRFTGGVRVAAADIDGDGAAEIVTAPGPGGGPHVRVFRLNGQEVVGFMAYASSFTGGVYLGSTEQGANRGDFVITGAGEGGGPHVRVWNPNGTERVGFIAGFPNNGVRVAGGRFRGTSPGDIALVGGPGSLSIVKLTRIDGSLLLLN